MLAIPNINRNTRLRKDVCCSERRFLCASCVQCEALQQEITEKEKETKAVETKVIIKLKNENSIIIDQFLEVTINCLFFSCAISGKNLKLNLKSRRNTKKRLAMTMKLQIYSTILLMAFIIYSATFHLYIFRTKCLRNKQ